MALRAHGKPRGRHATGLQGAQDLPGLALDLFLFFRDERDHVIGDVEGRDSGVSRAGDSLQRRDGYCGDAEPVGERSEEHTSELQSPCNLVCRLLLEKKKSNLDIPLCSRLRATTS